MFLDRAKSVHCIIDMRFHHTQTSTVAQGGDLNLVIIFFLTVLYLIFIIRVLHSTLFLPPCLSSLPWFWFFFFPLPFFTFSFP